MVGLEEFRTGAYSLPATDRDEDFAPCFSCVYLFYKEFSVGEGLYYYFCFGFTPAPNGGSLADCRIFPACGRKGHFPFSKSCRYWPYPSFTRSSLGMKRRAAEFRQ